ncbi:MAG: carboxypeptidase-like regulatory domain-containing protein [Bacteroidota bacterium]|nr:carboxypeptidase-like regulatory domain-containing protein [Bacteroidota bacterium]
MKRFLLAANFMLISLCNVAAQGYFISGIVLDSASKRPINNALVLIDGTTQMQLTDSSGTFKFTMQDKEPATVLVARKSYQTEAYEAKGDRNISMRFYLFKSKNIPVNSPQVEKNAPQFQSLFLQHLLGNSSITQSCEILNPGDLRFSIDETNQRVLVVGVAPIQIINEPMGYLLNTIVDDFTFSLRSNAEETNVFIGFKSLTSSNPTVLDRWKNNRSAAYKGSFMHFIRALCAGRVEEEGFNVSLIKRVYEDDPNYTNEFKVRDRKGEEQFRLPGGNMIVKKYVDIIDNSSKSELALAKFDSVSHEWKLNNHHSMMRVVYNTYFGWFNDMDAVEKASAAYDYLLDAEGKPVSLIVDHESSPCIIYKSGRIKKSGSMIFLGYWSQHDLATSLPFDYQP